MLEPLGLQFKQKDGHLSFENTQTGMIVSSKFAEKVKHTLLELGRLNPRRVGRVGPAGQPFHGQVRRKQAALE